jgi:hypothetical protein
MTYNLGLDIADQRLPEDPADLPVGGNTTKTHWHLEVAKAALLDIYAHPAATPPILKRIAEAAPVLGLKLQRWALDH